MKNKIFKIIWIISLIIELLVLIIKFFNKNTYETFNISYLPFAIVELINILFGILLFKKDNNKLIKVLYIVYIIITFFIPTYQIGKTYAPTGPGSERMGLAYEEKNLNVYGINIIGLYK